MKILEKLLSRLGVRKNGAAAKTNPPKRERPTHHQNSREIERRLRQEKARNAKKRS